MLMLWVYSKKEGFTEWLIPPYKDIIMDEITEKYCLDEEARWANKLWDSLFKTDQETRHYRHAHPQMKSMDRHAKNACRRRASDTKWPEIGEPFSPDEWLVRRSWVIRLDK